MVTEDFMFFSGKDSGSI